MTEFEFKQKKEGERQTNFEKLLRISAFLFLLFLLGVFWLSGFIFQRISDFCKACGDKLGQEIKSRLKADSQGEREEGEEQDESENSQINAKRREWLLKNRDYITIAGYKKAFSLNDYAAQKDIRLLREAGMLRKDPTQGNAHRLVLEAVNFD
jgi:hypothetical protein